MKPIHLHYTAEERLSFVIYVTVLLKIILEPLIVTRS